MKVLSALNRVKRNIKASKRMLEETFGVREIYVFGSYARGDQTKNSDVDLIVILRKPLGISFINSAEPDWVALNLYLEKILGKKVDVVTKSGIKPNRWRTIKNDLIRV